MGNIALIQTFRKEEQVPETRDRKVSHCTLYKYTVDFVADTVDFVTNLLPVLATHWCQSYTPSTILSQYNVSAPLPLIV